MLKLDMAVEKKKNAASEDEFLQQIAPIVALNANSVDESFPHCLFF